MGMKTRQRVELKQFNNFEENSNIQVKQFYNYLPTTKLKNCSGIKEASFLCNNQTEDEYFLNLKNTRRIYSGKLKSYKYPQLAAANKQA